MRLRQLIGAGDRILGFTLPFAVIGVPANVTWPSIFRMGLGVPGRVAGTVVLVSGVALYLASLIHVVVHVPRGRLITSGPYAVVRHPLYNAVALLVIPGVGLLLDSWLGCAIGTVMYVATRIFRGYEEARLQQTFGEEYRAYREKVLLPWL